MAGLGQRAQKWVTAAVVGSAVLVSWTPQVLQPASVPSSPMATLGVAGISQVRPLAFTSSGLVAAVGDGRLSVMPVTGGTFSPLATHRGSIGQAWGCGSSFVGLETTEGSQQWRTSVIWVDTVTRQVSRRSVPLTQRVLGATPRGFAVADSASGATVEVVGATGTRTTVAPLADSWACDKDGYAWTESQPGAWTEKAYRRSWSAPTAAPTLLVESERNLRVLSLSGGVALLSDSHRDGYTTRPTAVSLIRAASGVSPVPLWAGTDAVIEGAVASGANTYLRVTDRTSGVVSSRTYARDSAGAVRSLGLRVPAPSSATPMAPTTGGGAVVAVAGLSAGLYAIGGSSPVRVATWATGTTYRRG